MPEVFHTIIMNIRTLTYIIYTVPHTVQYSVIQVLLAKEEPQDRMTRHNVSNRGKLLNYLHQNLPFRKCN